MCLACEMDDLWLLYLEQQAQVVKKGAGAADAGSAVPLSAPAQSKSEPASAFICEEPPGE
jgi:hypothetical protein